MALTLRRLSLLIFSTPEQSGLWNFMVLVFRTYLVSLVVSCFTGLVSFWALPEPLVVDSSQLSPVA